MKKFGREQWKEGPLATVMPIVSAGMSVLGALRKSPKVPEASAPTVMPTQDSALTMEAKRRALVQQQQRGGRASTVLTEDNNTFGGS